MGDHLYERFRSYLIHDEELGLSLDLSRIDFPEGFLEAMEPKMARGFAAMADLEAGAIANPDEQRRVGHYWLRAPERAPEPALREAIEGTLGRVLSFAERVHDARLRPERASRFDCLLVIGIGGSALGPEFVSAALS